VIFFITLYLQQVLGYSALKTGVAYMPMSLSIITAPERMGAMGYDHAALVPRPYRAEAC
jgi:hypothetical protein